MDMAYPYHLELKPKLIKPKSINTYHTADGRTIVVATIYINGVKYVGKAKCMADDEFNQEFGEKLATLRANRKFFKKQHKHFAKIVDDRFKRFVEHLQAKEHNAFWNTVAIGEEIDTMLKETEDVPDKCIGCPMSFICK